MVSQVPKQIQEFARDSYTLGRDREQKFVVRG
jgi:hypothetical protein